MAIDRDTVLRAAHLARLEVNAAESEALVTRLNDILLMVDELQQADVADLTPLSHPLEVQQPLRPDTVAEADFRSRVMPLSPDNEAGCFLVPRVIE